MVSVVVPMGNRDKVYTGGQAKSQSRIIKINGDKRVDDLMLEFINFPRRTVYWEYRDKFITLTQELLNSRTNWFLMQDSNNLVSDIKIKFILDTVRFIFTGRRQIAINAWGDLLGADNGKTTDVLKRTMIYDYLKELDIVSSDALALNNFIQNWVSKPNGFDDMVFTIYYLFGTKQKKV